MASSERAAATDTVEFRSKENTKKTGLVIIMLQWQSLPKRMSCSPVAFCASLRDPAMTWTMDRHPRSRTLRSCSAASKHVLYGGESVYDNRNGDCLRALGFRYARTVSILSERQTMMLRICLLASTLSLRPQESFGSCKIGESSKRSIRIRRCGKLVSSAYD